jgi:hypothetical protein
MKRIIPIVIAVLWCTLVDPAAEGAPEEATIKLAKSHYEKGNAAYNLGKFDEAIGWFTNAYEAWPVPDFLYNIAQSYRLAGNCKQALFFYRRYLSIKDRDKDAPLARKERVEIERFIKGLTECSLRTDASAQTQPDTLKTTPAPTTPPPPTTTPPTTPPPPPTTNMPSPLTTTPATSTTTASTTPIEPTKAPTTTATATTTATEKPEDKVPAVTASAPPTVNLVKAYATGGIAIFSAGDLPVAVQPSFAVGAGYLVPAGPTTLDLGARISFSPIKYDTMDATRQASVLGICATVGATYKVNEQLGLRGDAGIGAVMLRGLVDGNPFTDTRKSGAFTMLSLRLGIAAEYAFTPNLIATVAPLGIGFSPAPDELFMSSLVQLDVLVGLGYRM